MSFDSMTRSGLVFVALVAGEAVSGAPPSPAPAAEPAVAAGTAAKVETAVPSGTAMSVPAAAVSPSEVASAEAAAAAAGEEEKESALVPFYSFHFTEGMSIPSIGGLFFGNNVGTTIGGKYGLGPEHALFGAYELSYQGPGMRAQEGHEFQERAIDHSVSGGHSWKISPSLLLSSRVQYLHEFRRTGANEQFGNGLYDFWSLGLAERVDLGLVPGIPLGGGLSYAYVRFPNYTDLLAEFQSASLTSELSGGAQDFHRFRAEGDAGFSQGQGRAWFQVSMLDYINAKVVSGIGTAGTTKQQDFLAGIGGSWKQVLSKSSGVITAEPALRVDYKTSNQNFVRYRIFGDPSSASFIQGNYDYVAPSLEVPVRWSFETGQALVFSPAYSMMAYTKRPPRDPVNNYITGKRQMNQTVALTLGYVARLYAYTNWTFGYTLQIQQSNNKFERFLPYNYTGHVVYTALDITY
jgi:hypothetical protein